jgi:hypothetical protein
MKRLNAVTIMLLAVVFVACGNSNETEAQEQLDELLEELVEDTDGCKKNKVDGWDEFMNIPYKGNELDLEKYLGKFTGGEYATDSSAFIYYFKRVQRAPVSVWVNAKTGDVETVFVEILGYEEYFDGDVADLQKEFGVDDCDVKYFGMQPSELIAVFGKADKDEKQDDGVRSLSYNSSDYKIALNFKFYESQGGVCSSISLNWFY